jgi:histidinol-phosphatase
VVDPELQDDVRLAHALADIADQTSLSYFGQGVAQQTKSDGSPVTAADLATERAVLALLRERRPDDAVLSEESGTHGEAARRWILDPIDGTAQFVAGERDWGSHVVLEVAGEVCVAIITRPCVKRRWWAVRGFGAYTSGSDTPNATDRPLRVSDQRSLDRARVGGYVPSGSESQVALSTRATWVSDPVSIFSATVEGSVDVMIDDGGHVWDLAPRKLLVTEAGGRFRDPHGGSRLDLGGGLYTNGHLEQAVTDVLRGLRFEGPPATTWR